MTASPTKSRQMRLDRSVLALPKWPKIRGTLRKRRCRTLTIDNLAPDAAVRVENACQNGQAPGNSKLLEKYQLIEMKLHLENEAI